MLTGFTPWPEEWADKYRKDGCWKGETFGGMLKERAALYGNQTAVTCKDVHWTYKELDERADRLAAGLHKLGIQKEDRVVVQLPNIAEFLK